MNNKVVYDYNRQGDTLFIYCVDDYEYEIGYPHSHKRGCISRERKSGSYLGEQDVTETQTESDTDVNTHSTTNFPRRERHADECEDKRGCCVGIASMQFDFKILYVGNSARFLLVDV